MYDSSLFQPHITLPPLFCPSEMISLNLQLIDCHVEIASQTKPGQSTGPYISDRSLLEAIFMTHAQPKGQHQQLAAHYPLLVDSACPLLTHSFIL